MHKPNYYGNKSSMKYSIFTFLLYFLTTVVDRKIDQNKKKYKDLYKYVVSVFSEGCKLLYLDGISAHF